MVKRFKQKFGRHTRKTFNRFTTKDGCTWNSTRDKESAAVSNLKPGLWRSPLVQEEKFQGEKACDKRRRQQQQQQQHNDNNNNF
jgi:hypothetical protein